MHRLGRWTWTAVAMALVFVGCDLFQPELDEGPPVEQPEDSATQQVQQQISDIETLRDREMSEDLEVIEGQPSGLFDESIPESVRQEWEWFERTLFGGQEAPLVVDNPSWAGRAGFDAEDAQLVFAGDPREEMEVAFASAMAISGALEQMAFTELPEAETVDAWLTRQIMRRSGPAFTSAVSMAQYHGIEVEIDDLAERPELAAQLPGMGPWLESMEPETEMAPMGQRPEGTEYFQEAIQQFVLRKALSVGSALYRAGGWTAVEWGRSEPPTSSDHVVHPRRWFEGDGQARWTWPSALADRLHDEGWQKGRDGRVGPAVTALWLEGLVGAQAARTIYAGWLDDAYRIYTRGEDDDTQTVFHWVTAWETPHDAQEIASAFEAVLGHYVGHEHREQRFRVAAQGVNVGVVIYDRDQPMEQVNRDVEMVAAAGPGFLPGDAAPFQFAPTLYERYVEQTEEAVLDLDTERWTDPAAGWQSDMDSLEGWTVQRSNEAHVRWFANHPDGSLIQWTTELVGPLDTEFGSRAYLDELAATFAESMSAEEPPEIEMISEPVDSTVELEVMGMIEDRPLVLRLWQWKRGDVLVTFSVQGPEVYFGQRLDEAMAVLGSLEPHGQAVQQREADPEIDPTEDEGIIEFEVGEQDGE